MPLSAADAAHLIRRAGFGVTPALLGELTATGSRAAAVDRMLDAGRDEADAFAPAELDPFHSIESGIQLMRQWWLDRMATSAVPLVEKMTLFWHGHFVSAPDKVYDRNKLLHQNQLFRAHALGRFNRLIQAVSIDPAMLLYLDNHTNVKDEPQENFGRELLEVFTLGPTARTEADVVAMTRAWTGHGMDDVVVGVEGSRYVFHPDRHDHGQKALFDLAPRNWDGPGALDELLFGARAEPMSRFVSAKLFSFLAYPIDADSPLAARLGSEFRASKLSIRALLRAILLSEEFWGPAAIGALVRSPAEWVVAALQGANLTAGTVQAERGMAEMGQALFHPPTVAGWGQNDYWVSTARTWARTAWAERFAATAVGFGFLSEVQTMSASDAVATACSRFGVSDPSPTTRAALERWVDRARAEGNAGLVPRDLTQLVLLSPDFQLA